MKVLDRLIDWTQAISRCSLWGVGAFLLVTVFLVGGEIVFRRMGSSVVHGATEVGGYMLAICSSWAFSYTLLNRANIRFDAVYMQLRSRGRALLDLFSLVGLGAFALVLTWYAWDVLVTSIELGAHSTTGLDVPMWLPQGFWVAGFVFLCWTILVLAVRCAVAIVMADYQTVFRLAGLENATDEAEQELASLSTAALLDIQANAKLRK
jgi:TRAP-type mannitol/chloroaromatic compound transport system permease small subunit